MRRGPSPAVATDVVGGPTTVPGFEEFRRIADGDTFGAVPGTLGSALSSVDSLAVGPGAAIALADTSGRVPDYVAASTPAEIGGYVQDALENGTRVVVVDAGVVRDPADLPSQEQAPAQSRAEQVAEVDARVAAVQRAVADSTGADATTLLAVSLADAGATAHLQFAAATGPQPGSGDYEGFLGSRSTRQTAIVQTTDLTPTVLALALGSDHGTPGWSAPP